MRLPIRISACALSFLTAALAAPVEAQVGGFGRKGTGNARNEAAGEAWRGRGPSRSQVEDRSAQINASGLHVAFPEGWACEPVSCSFASPTRYDGSRRPPNRNGGRHGGMDISLKEGTPLLAVADGEVLALGEGGLMEGIYLWLRHAPEDTDLPFWVFSKYVHLSALPTLKVGGRVRAGQAVGLSGATGTKGGHYGVDGYPHLHLSIQYGPSGEYDVQGDYGSTVKGRDATLDDPLILYLGHRGGLAEVRRLPESAKLIRVPVVAEDGSIWPPGSRTVWPVACRRR
jgi:murein DD-endopeptidase MepM/ murein hydrolase activator NlpD